MSAADARDLAGGLAALGLSVVGATTPARVVTRARLLTRDEARVALRLHRESVAAERRQREARTVIARAAGTSESAALRAAGIAADEGLVGHEVITATAADLERRALAHAAHVAAIEAAHVEAERRLIGGSGRVSLRDLPRDLRAPLRERRHHVPALAAGEEVCS